VICTGDRDGNIRLWLKPDDDLVGLCSRGAEGPELPADPAVQVLDAERGPDTTSSRRRSSYTTTSASPTRTTATFGSGRCRSWRARRAPSEGDRSQPAARSHGHTQQRRGITDGRWGRPALFRWERRKNLRPR
jgi:hypothetical protein